MSKEYWIPVDDEDLLGTPAPVNDDDLLGDIVPVMRQKLARDNSDLLGRPPKSAGGRGPQRPKRLCSRGTKRGRVLASLLEHGSIARVTEEVGLARSAVLTYCYEIWRDHGVGYEVRGDHVTMRPFDLAVFKD